MIKTVIHVNRHIIDANRKNGKDDPPISVIARGCTTHAHAVRINGPSVLIHAGAHRKPLKCGARVWIETHAIVDVTV